MAQKSILEQALLQVETLEDAVKANAKGILASTMKQELNDLLKEQEDAKDPEEEENDVTDPESADKDETSISDEEPKTDELPSEDEDNEPKLDSLPEDEPEMEDASGVESDDDDVLDMTNASEEEVLKVFKAMKPEDGIVVKKDGNSVQFSDNENEYIIKLDDEEEETPEFPENNEEEDETFPEGLSEELNSDASADDDEIVYEIELNDDDDDEKKCEAKEESVPGLKNPKTLEPGKGHPKTSNGRHGTGIKGMNSTKKYDSLGKGKSSASTRSGSIKGMGNPKQVEPKEQKECAECGGKEVEATEAARTKWNTHGDKGGANRAGLKAKKLFAAGNGKLNEEVETLRKQNGEYKKALVLFKDKLNEVAVFNANLAYATRLFTEHSTTKQEKLNILKRFDSISTITESKNLYSSVKAELETKKPVTESMAEKIASTPQTSTSEVLSEAKAYEDPQFKRMKDLMNKIK